MASLHKLITGRIMKKYRMGSYLEKKTMVERRKVVISNTERKQVVQNMADVKNLEMTTLVLFQGKVTM